MLEAKGNYGELDKASRFCSSSCSCHQKDRRSQDANYQKVRNDQRCSLQISDGSEK